MDGLFFLTVFPCWSSFFSFLFPSLVLDLPLEIGQVPRAVSASDSFLRRGSRY